MFKSSQLKKTSLALSLSLAFATVSTFATEHKSQVGGVGCQLAFQIDNETFERHTKKSNQFIYSDRYCINEESSRQLVEKELLPSRTQVRQLISRYKKAYHSLSTTSQKVSFVDAFLYRASKVHHLSLSDSDFRVDSLTLVISSSNAPYKLVSGYALPLFVGEPINKETLKTFSRQLSVNVNSPTSSFTTELVEYVLAGGDMPAIDTANSILRSLAYANSDGETDDENSSEDEEHRAWAEEQAEGWGDDWNWKWANDEVEEWIVLENSDTGQVVEAYHFSPSGD